jgi:hypothetical protein
LRPRADLTKNEIELVRFIYEGSFDWRVSGLALKGAKMTRMDWRRRTALAGCGGRTGAAIQDPLGRAATADRPSDPVGIGLAWNSHRADERPDAHQEPVALALQTLQRSSVVARTATLTTLSRVDGERRSVVVCFLEEARLI